MSRQTYTGPNGRADLVDLSDLSPDLDPRLTLNVAWWLITSPGWSPAWDQYMLAVFALRPTPGVPDAHLQFAGATHEVLVAAIDPTDGRWDVTQAHAAVAAGKSLPWLTPINLAYQFEATDDEMRQIGELCAQAVVEGRLIPEPRGIAGAREAWLGSIVKTLAHLRGEEHAP